MALTVSMSDLRSRARKRADMETSDEANHFIPDAEIDEYINEAYRQLVDLILDEADDEYFLSSTSLSSPWTLPADFYRVKGVDISIGGEDVPLRPFNFRERHKYTDETRPRYRVRNNGTLSFSPASATPTVTLWYVPSPATIASGGNLESINGWDDYILGYVAAKMVGKEERDPSDHLRDQAGAAARILKATSRIDSGEPATIVDVDKFTDDFYYNEAF